MILKSDQEPAIREPIEAVKRERSENIDIQCEGSPVGEHKSNGEVEVTIQDIQAQVRTMRLGLQSRYGSKVKMDHPPRPWLIKHAQWQDSPRKGEGSLRPLPQIGGCIWYQQPTSEGKDKLETRWGCGIFAGVKEESGELDALIEAGDLKVRGYKRKPEEDCWNQGEFASAEGL